MDSKPLSPEAQAFRDDVDNKLGMPFNALDRERWLDQLARLHEERLSNPSDHRLSLILVARGWPLPEEVEAVRREVERLRAEFDTYIHDERQGHADPCTYGSLCPYCEIERLTKERDEAIEARDFAEEKWQEACRALERHCETCPRVERLRAALRHVELVARPFDNESPTLVRSQRDRIHQMATEALTPSTGEEQ